MLTENIIGAFYDACESVKDTQHFKARSLEEYPEEFKTFCDAIGSPGHVCNFLFGAMSNAFYGKTRADALKKVGVPLPQTTQIGQMLAFDASDYEKFVLSIAT